MLLYLIFNTLLRVCVHTTISMPMVYFPACLTTQSPGLQHTLHFTTSCAYGESLNAPTEIAERTILLLSTTRTWSPQIAEVLNPVFSRFQKGDFLVCPGFKSATLIFFIRTMFLAKKDFGGRFFKEPQTLLILTFFL